MQKQLAEERVFQLTGHSPSVSGQALRQEPGGRNRSRDHKGTLLIGCFPLACLACLLHMPRNDTTQSKLPPPTSIINWENASQTCLQVEAFSQLMFFCSQLTLAYVKVTPPSPQNSTGWRCFSGLKYFLFLQRTKVWFPAYRLKLHFQDIQHPLLSIMNTLPTCGTYIQAKHQ